MPAGLIIFLVILFDLADPAFRAFYRTHLDTGQSVIQLLDGGSHLFHAAWEANLFSVVVDLAHRGDDCCGSAQSAFCKFRNFLKGYRSFLW